MNAARMLTVVLLLANAAIADQATSTAAPHDSALVTAARTSKPRKTSKTKVITNADVKRSRGKLLAAPPRTAVAPADAKKGLLEQQDDARHDREAGAVRLGAVQKKVDALEKELRRIEQSFYDENNPSYRDDVIQKSFDQVKRQLDDARRDLADARDAAGKSEQAN